MRPDGWGVPEVQVTNPSGGVLGGDRLDVEVSLGEGARVSLLTQGATKLYRGCEARQEARLQVQDGAFLEYLLHHAIPYAGSSFRQRTVFDLAPGATLVAWEVLCAGRLARGERFAFDRIRARTEVLRAGTPLAVDGLDLGREKGSEPFGGSDYLATALVCAPADLTGLASELRGAFREDEVSGLVASASTPCSGLCAVRVLARRCPDLYRALNLFRRVTRRHLDLPPPARAVE